MLRERFDCREGLADHGKARYRGDDGAEHEAHRVLVLDPACGTGSFLYAVIDHVREYYQTSGRAGMWRGYVKDHLLPRLFGFELLMAAYAMAHLKLGMQMAALDLPAAAREGWEYPFEAGERLGVYLTNTLDPGESQTANMFGPLRALTQEANAAIGVKRDLPIMVVLGNPPYSGHSANASRENGRLTWIGELIEDYKQVDGQPLGERNPKWLQRRLRKVHSLRPVAHPGIGRGHPGLHHQPCLSGQPDLSRYAPAVDGNLHRHLPVGPARQRKAAGARTGRRSGPERL